MTNLKDILGRRLEKFKNSDSDELASYSGIYIDSVNVRPRIRGIEVYIKSKSMVSKEMMGKIKAHLFRILPKCSKLSVYQKPGSIEHTKVIIDRCWDNLLKYLYKRIPQARLWLCNSMYEVEKDGLNIYIENNGLEMTNKKKILAFIDRYYEEIGVDIKVSFKEKMSDEKDDKYDIYEEDRELVEAVLNNNKASDLKASNHAQAGVIIGKMLDRNAVPTCYATNSEKDVIVEGEIFDLSKRELKNNSMIVTFGLTDYSNSIGVKLFLSEEKKEISERLKNNMWVKVKGNIKQNKYSNENELIAKDINYAKKPLRLDTCSEKRVELHLHTRYSAMDAICSPSEVINLAKGWGHKSVAFTDHGVVQCFPEVYEAARRAGIKPIYGVEAYVFDDEFPVMVSPPSINILEAEYVVTDIETTGLSTQNDEIIEIGAVKVKNGKIIDTFSALVKPQRPLPANITRLTGITNDMLKSSPSFTQVIPNFLDFLGNSIFVAHNAGFDAGFIRRDCQKLNLPFNNRILDTLALSQIVLSNLKNHKLDTVAKHLKIKMGSHHRAVDDANTAALILKHLLSQVINTGISNLSDINKIYGLSSKDVHLKSYHATLLVKNKEGLGNLYKLISLAHMDYFYRNPRIPKSLINSARQGLILGSGCQAGELFQGLLRNCCPTEIEQIINYYDYLEIQPVDNNDFLVRNGMISSKGALQDLNKRIYELGKKFDKPVVLTGDVHFLHPEEEICRKILLKAQDFHDAEHESRLYFRTTEEMLRECEYLGEKAAREVVIDNTNKIADEIEPDLKPIPDELYTPVIEGAESEIVEMTYRKARDLYGSDLPDMVSKRIEKELKSIVDNGYSVIYLIAHKLVKKSLEDGYLVGSRGSVGSSLVATLCGITEVNPLPPHYRCPQCKKTIFVEDSHVGVGPDLPDKSCPDCGSVMKKDGFNIPFEVFMGFEGDKVPDIDLNFSGEYQSRAHKFVEELFGKNNVFRAGTISTIAEKTAFGFVKCYFEEVSDEKSSYEIKRLATGITGIKRTTGQHPGGIMILPRDKQIYDFTPIQYPANDKRSGVVTTHFDYHSISNRLLKLDLLGHDDPTVLKILEEETGYDAKKISLDDEKTMRIFSSLDSLNLNSEDIGTTVGTLGVPEFGTRFVRQMLEETKPTTFSELVRISGLSHGTDVWLNNAQTLISKGIATLTDVIATRDDIMTYLIHKGNKPSVAFNIMEDVRKGKGLKPEFEGILSKSKKIDKWFIESCKKIKYLFPKAHAVAYVIMAFRIAFYKVHFPEAFYSTYFTVRADDFDASLILQGQNKIKEAMEQLVKKDKYMTSKEKSLYTVLEVANEMYQRGIQFVPIDLYKSDVKRFKITSEGILPPICTLPGLGSTAAHNISIEREKGKFSSIEDLRKRTRVTRNVIQILKDNGVLRGLQETDQLSLF
ncbi:MAG: PolC-type DNA polymerase III [Tepidanaerobacteraceae bacterium]